MSETLEIKARKGIRVNALKILNDEQVLTAGALRFVEQLENEFGYRRVLLLEARKREQAMLDSGYLPDFLRDTINIRQGEWKVLPIPDALQNRRVEITGPVDRKMIINGLNSGANVFMADFEDSTSPTWSNVVEGQVNLMDAVRGTISYQSNEGKSYELNSTTAVLNVRPRGWHLEEKNVLIDGKPISASLFDFGLFAYHNGSLLADKQAGPFFYLPKLENHLEARLWNDVFLFAERSLGLTHCAIKATVLIETILAAFEMEEIIYELRDHIAGLNAGRWDYIFSIIKKLKTQRSFVMPERAAVTMTVPFMSAYAKLLVKTCHKRGIHAMGGMSAFIPSKDEEVNRIAFEKVKADKEREAKLGHDVTWVAHPKMVGIAKVEFDKVLGLNLNQKNVLLDGVVVTSADLLNISSAGDKITEEGVRTNIRVALQYIESWLTGVGAVALYNLMEDAATAEISRAQLWQWLHHKNVFLDNGRLFDVSLYKQLEEEEMDELLDQFRDAGRDKQYLNNAEEILNKLVLGEAFEDFLTTIAYQKL